MASLSLDKASKTWRIQVFAPDGSRRAIRLGAAPKALAEATRQRVAVLEAAARLGVPPDPATAIWLAQVGDEFHGKLFRAGLVVARPPRLTLGEAVASYEAAWLSGNKPETQAHKRGHLAQFVDLIGQATPLARLTSHHCERYVAAVKSEYAAGTASARVTQLKSFFTLLVTRRVIAESPFEGVETPAGHVDRSKQFYVSPDLLARVLVYTPVGARVAAGLARFGGLRCPSETSRLRWQDIDRAAGSVLVHSPKTERYAGRETRVIPLFPALVLILTLAVAERVDDYVVPRSSSASRRAGASASLRAACLEAGVTPWPKLLVNLRASCATDLIAAGYSQRNVADWLGHAPEIGHKHYHQTRESDFRRAAGLGAAHDEAHPSPTRAYQERPSDEA